jgi:hypothetical protein
MKPMLSDTLESILKWLRVGFSVFSEELARANGTISAVAGSMTILPCSAGHGLFLPHGTSGSAGQGLLAPHGFSAGHGPPFPHGFSTGHGPPDPHGFSTAFSAGQGRSAPQGASDLPPTIILS